MNDAEQIKFNNLNGMQKKGTFHPDGSRSTIQ